MRSLRYLLTFACSMFCFLGMGQPAMGSVCEVIPATLPTDQRHVITLECEINRELLYYSYQMITTTGIRGEYPVYLDASMLGTCTAWNPCFTNLRGVLRRPDPSLPGAYLTGITDGSWTKVDSVTYQHISSNTTCAYDNTLGTFLCDMF